jgi:hypothetical protein
MIPVERGQNQSAGVTCRAREPFDKCDVGSLAGSTALANGNTSATGSATFETKRIALHLGHLPFLPAYWSATLKANPQPVQRTGSDIVWHSKRGVSLKKNRNDRAVSLQYSVSGIGNRCQPLDAWRTSASTGDDQLEYHSLVN